MVAGRYCGRCRRTRGHQLQKEAEERHVLQDWERQQKGRRGSGESESVVRFMLMVLVFCGL